MGHTFAMRHTALDRALNVTAAVRWLHSRALRDQDIHQRRVLRRHGCRRVHRAVRTQGRLHTAEAPLRQQEGATTLL